MKKEDKKNQKIEKTTQYLKYQFSKEEKADLADSLARGIGELEQKTLQKKDVVKAIDADIAKLESTVSLSATKVKDGYEYRNIDCIITSDYDTKTKTITRIDTEEVVRTTTMTAEELQQPLPMEVVA
jgi:hypothetical protein